MFDLMVLLSAQDSTAYNLLRIPLSYSVYARFNQISQKIITPTQNYLTPMIMIWQQKKISLLQKMNKKSFALKLIILHLHRIVFLRNRLLSLSSKIVLNLCVTSANVLKREILYFGYKNKKLVKELLRFRRVYCN